MVTVFVRKSKAVKSKGECWRQGKSVVASSQKDTGAETSRQCGRAHGGMRWEEPSYQAEALRQGTPALSAGSEPARAWRSGQSGPNGAGSRRPFVRLCKNFSFSFDWDHRILGKGLNWSDLAAFWSMCCLSATRAEILTLSRPLHLPRLKVKVTCGLVW